MTKMMLARMTMIKTRMTSSRMISARLKVIRVGRRRRQQVWPPTPLITLFHSNEGEEFSREGEGRKISKSSGRVTFRWENRIFFCGLVGDEHSSSVVRSHSS